MDQLMIIYVVVAIAALITGIVAGKFIFAKHAAKNK